MEAYNGVRVNTVIHVHCNIHAPTQKRNDTDNFYTNDYTNEAS